MSDYGIAAFIAFSGWLLTYCVGVGGSSQWTGSSAGVAVGQTFPEAHDTKKWRGRSRS